MSLDNLLIEKKNKQRIKLKKIIKNISISERENWSEIIIKKTIDYIDKIIYKNNISKFKICIYYSFNGEVKTQKLIKYYLKNGSVLIPKCNGSFLDVLKIESFDDLTKGIFNILEPKDGLPVIKREELIDFIIVPGLGYDRSLNRLGRGKGYYDRFLSKSNNNLKIGLAFDQQIIDHIPYDNNDQKVDLVITQSNTIMSSNSVEMV